ncbi:DNA-binding response OmpR family regulator [Sedimentibacter acidaminivorans]|uniref:DNA-binding response OmpR family regulator n=1 Tax=Sedimentibacter acidaminivorans TaxID=913099 RepID=A0ABS4GEA9_9FIRM|nr:response regulator transcription factor [Sedimentibacter acidaminivorans]MBP1925695.1 DNA-binding response OmpR family regulator [Sedimentibacter acidaminivorans]
MRILIVEDEVKITQALKFLFSKQKIDVDIANDGEEGLILSEKEIYDVIILDIMLPGVNGIEILKSIRKAGNKTPVIMLTAKDAVDDRVFGLETGADDYLVKPFATKELIARVKALARRKNTEFIGETYEFENIKYDVKNYLLYIDNVEYKIPLKEAMLMEMFIKKPRQVFTREQIIDRIWGLEADILESNIEIYVHHLRKRLESTNAKIETVRGVGYMLKEK